MEAKNTLFIGVFLVLLISFPLQATSPHVAEDFEASPQVAADNFEASPFSVTVEPSRVAVQIAKEPDQTFRVWHTSNPMKVIIDSTQKVQGAPSHMDYSDVALRVVRSSALADGGTRIVLEFNYLLPEPTWSETDKHLTVEVPKQYIKSTEQLVTPGVRYGHQRRAAAGGPNIVNYLKIDIQNPEIELKLVLAQDRITGRELVSSMAKRAQAISAVNGAYFAADGRPLGLLAIDGILISEPYAQRTALGLGPEVSLMDRVDFIGEVLLEDGSSARVTGVNRPRLEDDLILYTPYWGQETRTNIYGYDVAVVDGVVTDTNEGSTVIPADGFVLSGHGQARDFLSVLEVGDCVDLGTIFQPDWFGQGVLQIIGGGPRLVRDGEIFITGQEERFQNDILIGRAPRTALGFTANGKLLLVTVNGRQPGISVGMTLTELAELMIELGAVQAMNLDGGGSTTMVIRDKVLNLPSDNVERPVSNAIVVITPESRR